MLTLTLIFSSPMLNLIYAALSSVAAASAPLGLSIANDGSYSVSMGGKPLLKSGPTVGAGLSSADGSLVITQKAATTSGSDALGDFNATAIGWGTPKASATMMVTTFKTYTADTGMIVLHASV